MCIFELLITLAVARASLVTAEIIDIAPSSNISGCSPYCVTLIDFASKALQTETGVNSTLILQPGNHSLLSPLVVANTDTFVMYSRTKDAIITCNQSGFIKFINVSTVHLLNLTFSDCGNSFNTLLEFRFVNIGTVDQCSMRQSKGRIVHSYESIIKIVNTHLTTTSSKNGAISLEASTMAIECCTIINNTFQDYGAIYAFNRCILSVSQSTFANNLVRSSALIWLESSYMLLYDRVTISNNACFLGVLFVTKSLVQSNSELRVTANIATLHNIYIAQSQIMLIQKLLYSENHGTLLIIERQAILSGLNQFTFFMGGSLNRNSKCNKCYRYSFAF